MTSKVLSSFAIVILFTLVTVNFAQSSPVPIQCGTIVESELTSIEPPFGKETDNYSLELSANDAITIEMIPVGTTPNIYFRLFDPSYKAIYDTGWGQGRGQAENIQDFVVPASGTYTIGLGANSLTAYTLYVGCLLRDGTKITAGSTVVSETSQTESNVTEALELPFTGYGFPGVSSIDFSAGIEIPLQLGQAQTAPIGSDVILYTIDTTAESTSTLTLSRVSGDISVGVTVTKKDTNEIIFLSGLPSGNNLSVELTFPSDGTYVFGLFRLDTAERTDTSGAVQITLE